MFRLFVTLCIFGVTLSAAAELYNEEPCTEVEGVKDFNLTRFSGFWYRVEVDGELSEDDKQICDIIDIVIDKNNVFRAINYLIGGPSMIQDKLNPSKFLMNHSDYNHTVLTILATDYRSYAVIYACSIKSNLNSSTPSIEINTRAHEPLTLDFNETIKDVLMKNNLGQRNLLSPDLKLCEGIQMVGRGKNEFRDPTVNEDRTHCKLGRRIEGVKDFDRNRFMGSWYEIQSNLQKKRHCGPSNFSLVENNTKLHISNSNNYNGYYVLNRKYPAHFWTYIPFETMMIGKFYTVLETDYDSYAILYACSYWSHPNEIITLARKNEQTGDFRTKIDEALLKNDYGITYLFPNSQSNCKKD